MAKKVKLGSFLVLIFCMQIRVNGSEKPEVMEYDNSINNRHVSQISLASHRSTFLLVLTFSPPWSLRIVVSSALGLD